MEGNDMEICYVHNNADVSSIFIFISHPHHRPS